MRSFAAVGIISVALLLATAPSEAAAQRAAPHLSYGGMRGMHAMPSAGRHMGGTWRGSNWGGSHSTGGRWNRGTWNGSRFGGTQWNGTSWRGNFGSRWGGRTWHPGHRWTGSWAHFRRPFVGFVVPPFWLGPSYSILDYSDYGLSEPPYGYSWSRYYDDAVMVDREGRVRDFVSPEWDEKAYDESGYDYSHDVSPSGIDYFDGDDQVVYSGTWRGTWTGSYEGGPVTTYRGEFRSDDRGPPPRPLPPPRYEGPPPHLDYGPEGWSGGYAAGGYIAGGYYYPAPTITTVTIRTTPVVTTTTSFVEETYTKPVARAKPRIRHHWKPKPKPRCYCR